MGNRHGSMGVTINYDADLQASVETASVDKAMDIEADLKDKLQSKIKENEGVEATVTVDLDYYDKVDEVATFNVNIQFEDEGTVKFAEFDGDYYQPPDADDLIHEERDLEGIIDEAMADLGYPDANAEITADRSDDMDKAFEKAYEAIERKCFMENENKIMLDENAGIMIDDGKVNAVAFLFDAQYKEFAERTNLLKDAEATFEELLEDGDTFLDMSVNFSPNGEVSATLNMQSDTYGYESYAVPLEDSEKQELREELDRIARYNEMTIDELMEEAMATVQVRNMLVNEDGNLFATMEVNRSRMEEMLNDANSPLLEGKNIHELVYFNDAASPILAAEINRDESVQVSAIMRDGYEEIEVPLSLDDNTIAEIKDAVKENVEQSYDVSVQHFFETAEPNHNYSQEEVHALAETVGKFVTAYQEYQEPEKEFSLEKNIQRIEEGLTSPEVLPRLTAELDKAIDDSQRTTSEGIFLLPDRIVEQAVEVAQQMEMYTKPLGFEKNEIVQFDGEVIMDTETADGETKPTINLALYMTDDFMEQALDRAGIFDVNNPAYQADSFEELMFNEDGTFKTYVNGYIDISENKEVDFRLYTSGDAEINVPLSDSEKRVVLDKAEAYIEQETGMTFEQNIEDLRNSSNDWYAVKMDIGDTVNAFFENGGAEPTTSKSGTFTVAKAPEGEAIQLIDNDLKMSMAEMTPADNGYVIQNSINAVIKEGLENGLKRADMVASQEVQKEQPAPEKKHKQSIERD